MAASRELCCQQDCLYHVFPPREEVGVSPQPVHRFLQRSCRAWIEAQLWYQGLRADGWQIAVVGTGQTSAANALASTSSRFTITTTGLARQCADLEPLVQQLVAAQRLHSPKALHVRKQVVRHRLDKVLQGGMDVWGWWAENSPTSRLSAPLNGACQGVCLSSYCRPSTLLLA